MRPRDDERCTQYVDLDAHHRRIELDHPVRGGGHELQPLSPRGPKSTTLTAIRRSH
jgi:hypothetical protein